MIGRVIILSELNIEWDLKKCAVIMLGLTLKLEL